MRAFASASGSTDAQISKHQRDFLEWARSEPGVVVAVIIVVPPEDSSPSSRRSRRPLQRADRHRKHPAAPARFPGIASGGNGSTSRRWRPGRRFRSLRAGDGTTGSPETGPCRVPGRRLPAPSCPFVRGSACWPSKTRIPFVVAAYQRAFGRCCSGEDTTGFAITHFKPGQPTGEVLLRGAIPTRHFYLLNEAALHEGATTFDRGSLRQSLRGVFPNPARDRKLAYPCVPAKRMGVPISPPILPDRRCGGDGKPLNREEVWQVCVPAQWLARRRAVARDPHPNPLATASADPFVIQRDGGDYCFVEDHDRATSRGCISVYAVEADGAKSASALSSTSPFTCRFPSCSEYQGGLFMCPESSEHQVTSAIYRCVDLPLKWELAKSSCRT